MNSEVVWEAHRLFMWQLSLLIQEMIREGSPYGDRLAELIHRYAEVAKQTDGDRL